jgi:D-alanyl-D-alanine carboxypeptidase
MWIASMGLAPSPSHWLRVAGLLMTLLIACAGWDQAEARSPRNDPPRRVIHGPNYRPPYAAIVVDDKSGFVLHEVSADDPRHPASLTKIMTLYLLFEQLEAGTLALDIPLQISTRAAMQNPTKLGLKANQTIKVEDAIKGLVTKSANDAAVVVAEAIAGSEEEFAKLMTLKARALGMTSTTYINASGLPAEEQITTARDQAVLGRAIQHRFPGYYQYFATPSFHYKGAEMRNHNALLGQVKGVDGIKTGYTEASGYNLVSSVRRDEKHIVAVVLGGTSNAARDARMRQLIEDNISLASTHRTVPIIMEANGQRFADGGWALYLAAQRLKDERWRYQSPSRIARFYGDLRWKGTDAQVHLVASEANNFFGVIVP